MRVPHSGSARPDEIEAHFKMTALELTPDARKVFDRAVTAAGPAPAGTPPGGSLALPLPAELGGAAPARDPFTFTAGTRRPPVAAAPTGPGAPPPVEGERSDVEVKGIFGFPGGFLAIVNNQIVKAGDTVAGYRVERITEGSVILRERSGGSRVVTLPALPTAPSGAPRR